MESRDWHRGAYLGSWIVHAQRIGGHERAGRRVSAPSRSAADLAELAAAALPHQRTGVPQTPEDLIVTVYGYEIGRSHVSARNRQESARAHVAEMVDE